MVHSFYSILMYYNVVLGMNIECEHYGGFQIQVFNKTCTGVLQVWNLVLPTLGRALIYVQIHTYI